MPEIRKRLDKLDIKAVSGYGHLGNFFCESKKKKLIVLLFLIYIMCIGDGNLHLNVAAIEHSDKISSAIEPYVYEWTSKHKGSISAEHGIGFLKSKYLKYSKSNLEIELMKKLKNTIDPKKILNPYKIFPQDEC